MRARLRALAIPGRAAFASRASIASIAALAAITCAPACGHAPPPAAAPMETPGSMIADTVPIDEIAWVASSSEAQARASEEHKPLLVFVRAAWSTPSVIMDSTIWQDSRILREAPRFIALRIDVTNLAKKQVPDDLVKEYGIETIPTTLVVNTDGSVVARFGLGLARAADVSEAMHKAR